LQEWRRIADRGGLHRSEERKEDRIKDRVVCVEQLKTWKGKEEWFLKWRGEVVYTVCCLCIDGGFLWGKGSLWGQRRGGVIWGRVRLIIYLYSLADSEFDWLFGWFGLVCRFYN
jgi:hypothetical protein